MGNIIDFESIRSGKFVDRNAQDNPPEDALNYEDLAEAAETAKRMRGLAHSDVRTDDLNHIQDESVRRAAEEHRKSIETRRKAIEQISDEVREELTDQVVGAVRDAMFNNQSVRLPNGEMIVKLDKPVIAGSGDQSVTIPAGFISVPTRKDGSFPPSLFDASREMKVLDPDGSWMNRVYDFKKDRFRDDLNETHMNMLERMVNTAYMKLDQGVSRIRDMLTQSGVNPALAVDRHATLYDHTYSGEVFRKAQQVGDWSSTLRNQKSPVGTLEELDIKTSRDVIRSLHETQDGLKGMEDALKSDPSAAKAYDQWVKHHAGTSPSDQFMARKAESTLENIINRNDSLAERMGEQMERVRQATEHLNSVLSNEAQRDAVVKLLSGPLNGEFKQAYSPGETLKMGDRMGKLMGNLRLEDSAAGEKFKEAMQFFQSDAFKSMMERVRDIGKEIAEAVADLANKLKNVFGAGADGPA